MKVLEGRNVVLFPDLNGFDKWSRKVQELSHLAKFIVSDLLETKATETEKNEGLDFADYLLKFPLNHFRNNDNHCADVKIKVSQVPEVLDSDIINEEKLCKHKEKKICKDWTNEIEELEIFFSQIQPISEPIILNQCNTIKNLKLFIDSHLETIKTNSGKIYHLPYLNRLQALKDILKQKL